MVESTGDGLRLEELRVEVRPALATFAEKLQADIGDNVLSLSVVGSSLTDDFDPRRSDINTVLVVKRRSHELLRLLAGYGKSMGKRKLRAPLLMTEEYIQQSLDVFAVEFLEFQLNHQTVYGPDPFAGLAFEKNDVRLQCERELKAALISLRQGYVQAMGKSKLVGGLVLACTGQLIVLMRALLWLVDGDRPRTGRATLEAAGERFKFDAGTIGSVVSLRQQHGQPAPDQVEGLFEGVYQAADLLARAVDQLGTK